MQIKNTPQRFGAIAGLTHWVMAAAFILSYPIMYYVIWVLDADRKNPLFLPVLNLHWVLGMLVGVLVVPRLVWRLTNTEPDPAPGTPLEHLLSTLAHWGLYGLMVTMPLTGTWARAARRRTTCICSRCRSFRRPPCSSGCRSTGKPSSR